MDQRHVESKFLSDIFLNEEVFQYQQAMKDQRLPFEEKKVDFNIAYSQEPNEEIEEGPVDFYDSSVHFLAPFFVVDLKTRRSMSFKVSLECLISNTKKLGHLMISLLSRSNNKKILHLLLK